MLAGISVGYDRDLAGLQLGWRRLLLRRLSSHEISTAASDGRRPGAEARSRLGLADDAAPCS
jgi:hypothetical protein